MKKTRARVAFVIAVLASSFTAAADSRYDATLSGFVADVVSPDSIWIGAIEVRLRGVFVREEEKAEALRLMRALTMRREVECRLTGERLTGPEGPLVGHCYIFGPTDGREIGLGRRLLERGFARTCNEAEATTVVRPSVYSCQ